MLRIITLQFCFNSCVIHERYIKWVFIQKTLSRQSKQTPSSTSLVIYHVCSPLPSSSFLSKCFHSISSNFHPYALDMGILRCVCSVGMVIGLAFATTVPSKALEGRDSQCPAGQGWALPVLTIGGQGGTSSCETSFGNDYRPIAGIEVWRKGDGDDDGDRISGMHVFLRIESAMSS